MTLKQSEHNFGRSPEDDLLKVEAFRYATLNQYVIVLHSGGFSVIYWQAGLMNRTDPASSCRTGTGSLSGGQSGRGVPLTTHLHSAPRRIQLYLHIHFGPAGPVIG